MENTSSRGGIKMNIKSRKANIKWTDRGRKETKDLIKWFGIVGDEQDLIEKYECIKTEVEEGRINRRNPQDIISEAQTDRSLYTNEIAYMLVLNASREYWRILAKVLGESNVSHKSANTRTKLSIDDEEVVKEIEQMQIDMSEGCRHCEKFLDKYDKCLVCGGEI